MCAYLVQHFQNIYKIRINYAIQYTVHLGEIWTHRILIINYQKVDQLNEKTKSYAKYHELILS